MHLYISISISIYILCMKERTPIWGRSGVMRRWRRFALGNYNLPQALPAPSRHGGFEMIIVVKDRSAKHPSFISNPTQVVVLFERRRRRRRRRGGGSSCIYRECVDSTICMCVCVCVHISIHICIYVYICMYMYVYIYIYT